MLDPVALVWVAASLAGTVIAGWGVRDGRADIQALSGYVNGRRLIADDYLRSQLIRLIVCATWLAFGIPVLFDPIVTPLNAYTAMFIVTNSLLALAAALSMRARLLLMRSR